MDGCDLAADYISAPMSAATPTAAVLRAVLTSRCGEDPPGAWQSTAAASGVSGADAFLCHLSRSIASALEYLASSAAAAHARLQSARDTVHLAEAHVHCDELEAGIISAEYVKRAALERELCVVDAALERLRTERGGVIGAATSLSDDELLARTQSSVPAWTPQRRCCVLYQLPSLSPHMWVWQWMSPSCLFMTPSL